MISRSIRTATVAILMAATLSIASVNADEEGSKVYDYKLTSLAGKEVDMEKYKGKVMLIVNVASKCGLTPQYEQLQALHEKYSEDGLAVVGFPCNQFGSQEPGTSAQISEFCTENYGVEFDMFSKVEVNGDGATDLYKYLTSLDLKPAGKGDISWNFEKFLVDRNGKVIARFSPRTKPNDKEVISAIEAQLKGE